MNEIEAGVDIGGHASARGLDEDAPGRGRAAVARADRRRGIDDDRRQPLPDHRFDQPFGGDLAALIGAYRLILVEADALVGGRALAQRQCRDAAGIDDARDAGLRGRLHDVARPLDIGGHDLAGIARPEPIIGGDVKEIAHALHRRLHRGGVAKIALRDLDAVSRQIGERAGRADERAHRLALRQQRRRHRRSDKTRRPCHQHALISAHFKRHGALTRLDAGSGLTFAAVNSSGALSCEARNLTKKRRSTSRLCRPPTR